MNNLKKQNENDFKNLNTNKETNNNNKIQKQNLESYISEERKKKETEDNNLLKEKKRKEKDQNLICFAIINNEYSNKIKFFIKSENKFVDSTVVPNYSHFENINIPNYKY